MISPIEGTRDHSVTVSMSNGPDDAALWIYTTKAGTLINMRSHVEFRSVALRDPYPAIGGTILANILKASLPQYGFEVIAATQEDWGVHIAIENEAFALWIGCGHYAEYPDGHLCFIEPSIPIVRRWLKKISTVDTVERLASAIDHILTSRDDLQQLRWWTEAEAAGKPD